MKSIKSATNYKKDGLTVVQFTDGTEQPFMGPLSRIESLQLSGMDQKGAHIAALKEFARSHFDTENL